MTSTAIIVRKCLEALLIILLAAFWAYGIISITTREIDHHGFVTAYASTSNYVVVVITRPIEGDEEALALKLPASSPPLPDLSPNSDIGWHLVTITTSGNRLVRIKEALPYLYSGKQPEINKIETIWEAPR